MKKIVLVLAFVAFLAGLTSCKSMLPARFEHFVDKVEKEAPNYTEKDWDKASKKFESLVAQYEKAYENLSKEDRKRINKAIGQYQALVIKYGFSNALDSFTSVMKDLQSKIGELIKGAGSFLDELLN